VLGVFGQLHPRIAARFDLEQHAVMVAELDFDELCRAATDQLGSTSMPSTFPSLKLDLALIVPEQVAQEQVAQLIREAGGELLEAVELFDLYRGAPIPVGQKSLAYTLSFRAPDRTLTDVEAAAHVEAIELRLAEQLGAHLRRS
jgi:phenylalanyl-tRNA synthetase beta chain